MRRGVDHLLLEREITRPLVDVGEHGLVLLREQRDEVHLRRRGFRSAGIDLDAAGALIDRVGRERRLGQRSSIGSRGSRPVRSCATRTPRRRDRFLPSPLKSAASTLGDARPAVQPERGAELPLAEPAQPDHGALLVIGGKELAHVGDEQILDAVRVDVGEGDVRRVRDAGDDRQRARRRAGRPVKTTPWRMSVPSTSSRPSPSKSTSDTCETAGGPGIPAWSDRAARTGPASRSGPARAPGAGSRSGARRDDRTAAPAPCPAAAGPCGRPRPGGPIGGSRFSRMNIIRTNFVAPGVARQDVGRRKGVAPTARSARLLLFSG